MSVDRKIKNSLDPFVIIEISTTLTQQECDLISENFQNILTQEEMSTFQEDILVGSMPDSQNEYLILNKSMVDKVKIILEKANYPHTICDNIFERIWNSTEKELCEFLDMFGHQLDDDDDDFVYQFFPDYESIRERTFSTLIVMAQSRYDLDDVLDIIFIKGEDSLNSINRAILDTLD